jgi:hypothetical protein
MMLLAGELGHVELTEVARFAEDWEGEASLRLRRHDVSALADYDDHGRIRGNAPDQAMEDARRLYVSRYVQGENVELIIYSNALAREMAAWVRDDLVHLGLVSGGPGVELAGGARASAGDVIIARRNDHPDNVANSDVLQVEAVHGDGTVTARRSAGRDESGRLRWEAGTFRFDECATADLAYGATAHTKQGKTVSSGIVLVTGNEPPSWVYSAMTRGGRENIACVFTSPADPAEQDPGTRPAPDLQHAAVLAAEREGRPLPPIPPESPGAREGLAVLAGIVSRDDQQVSATAYQRRALADADHLAALNAIWTDQTAGPTTPKSP